MLQNFGYSAENIHVVLKRKKFAVALKQGDRELLIVLPGRTKNLEQYVPLIPLALAAWRDSSQETRKRIWHNNQVRFLGPEILQGILSRGFAIPQQASVYAEA